MDTADPSISLCMIALNEAENLPRCLESVKGLVDEMIVVDTGSTDETVAVAESYGARVLYHRWTDDFAAARNVGLAAARGDWILVLDADEELDAGSRHLLRDLCRNQEVEAYCMQQVHLAEVGGIVETENCWDVDLWRNRPGHRFEGSLHEQIVTSIRTANPAARVETCGLRILHYGFLREAVQSKGKVERNLRIIRQLVAEHPDDFFHRYNLGLELMRLQDYARAAAEFEQARAGISANLGWWPLWAAKLFKSLASCLILLQRWAEAGAVLRHGLAIYPSFTDLVFLQGVVAQEQGQHERAIACFELCLRLGPSTETGGSPGMACHRAHWAAANSHRALGRVEAAARAYEAAFRAQPDWLAPLANLVEVLSGHIPDQELSARVSAHFGATLAQHRIRLAEVFLSGGRPDLALATLEPAPVQEAEVVRYLQGEALLRLGHFAEASQILGALPPEAGARTRAALLVASTCGRGRRPFKVLARQDRLTAADCLAAARLCLGEARFWEEVGGGRRNRPPWLEK